MALKGLALQLTGSQATTTANQNSGVINPVPRLTESPMGVVASPALDRASNSVWYLFADPNYMPAITLGLLNGRAAPTVNPLNNGSALRMELECIFDDAAAATHWEAAYRSA